MEYLKLLGEPRSAQILLRYPKTSLSTSSGTIFGTKRMLNFPTTFAGITVFAPAPANAPSMPKTHIFAQFLSQKRKGKERV